MILASTRASAKTCLTLSSVKSNGGSGTPDAAAFAANDGKDGFPLIPWHRLTDLPIVIAAILFPVKEWLREQSEGVETVSVNIVLGMWYRRTMSPIANGFLSVSTFRRLLGNKVDQVIKVLSYYGDVAFFAPFKILHAKRNIQAWVVFLYFFFND